MSTVLPFKSGSCTQLTHDILSPASRQKKRDSSLIKCLKSIMLTRHSQWVRTLRVMNISAGFSMLCLLLATVQDGLFFFYQCSV